MQYNIPQTVEVYKTQIWLHIFKGKILEVFLYSIN